LKDFFFQICFWLKMGLKIARIISSSYFFSKTDTLLYLISSIFWVFKFQIKAYKDIFRDVVMESSKNCVNASMRSVLMVWWNRLCANISQTNRRNSLVFSLFLAHMVFYSHFHAITCSESEFHIIFWQKMFKQYVWSKIWY